MTDHEETYRKGANEARKGLGEAIGKALSDGDLVRAMARRHLDEKGTYEPYEPSGAIWEAASARRGGRDFEGGAVCWNPAEKCEGICRVCPQEAA